jgi:hypothetical protein
MAEATKHYHDRETMAMARFISRRAVKDEINRKGLKLWEFSFKQIVEGADNYLRWHADELMWQVMVWQWEKGFAQLRSGKPRGMGSSKVVGDVD